MLTLDTPIKIDGVETTPDRWTTANSTDKNKMDMLLIMGLHGLEQAQDYWLDLFHDHIANKNLQYEIIEDGE